MGCVPQSITNLCELDGWIKATLVTLPVSHSDSIADLGLCLCSGIICQGFLLPPGADVMWPVASLYFAYNKHSRFSLVQNLMCLNYHLVIFSRQSALLQACLGCYNNSCCYICHCCGSRLAKRATYITSLLSAGFHLFLPASTFAFCCLFVFISPSDFAYLKELSSHGIKPLCTYVFKLCEDRQLKYTEFTSSRN